jgi:predicted ATPase
VKEMPMNDSLKGGGRYSIIIGENGSGKSYLLNKLAKKYVSKGFNVIGIANSIHDKFTLRSKYFSLLGARMGRTIASKTIKRAFKENSDDDVLRLRKFSEILTYAGYSGRIGFRLNGIQEIELFDLDDAEYLNEEEKSDVRVISSKYFHMHSNYNSEQENVIWLGRGRSNYEEVESSVFQRLIKLETKLKKLGFIKSIDVLLEKEEKIIGLNQASSGELAFITSMIYISTVITERTIILVDEPENSLHPLWQKEYFAKLLDLFHYYDLEIVLATHSPLIVSGAANGNTKIHVYKAVEGELTALQYESQNLESLLWSFFSITTPESRFMSEYFVSMLNRLAEKKANLDEVLASVEAFKVRSYDENQIRTLDGIQEIAFKIDSKRNPQ